MGSNKTTKESYQKVYEHLKGFGVEVPIFALQEKLTLLKKIGHPDAEQLIKKQKLVQTLDFLEMGFSAKWLFPMDCHKTDKTLANPVEAIPILLDTSYIVGMLHNYLSPILIDTFVRVAEETRNKVTGLFNYVLWHDDSICCDDVDTTSVTIMALLTINRLNFAEAQTLGIKLLEICQKNEHGVIGTYIEKNRDTHTTLLHQAAMGKCHIDVGVLVNTMWLMGKLQLDSRPEVQPSLNLLDSELKRLLDEEPSEIPKENYKYYTNTDTIIFLFSQFVNTACSANRARYEELLKKVIRKRIADMNPKTTSCLNMLYLVLAAFNLDLENEIVVKAQILKLLEEIINQQDKYDGKFPNYFLYVWVKQGYYGSQYITTAFALKAIFTAKEKLNMDFDGF